MPDATDRVVIREIARGVPRAKPRTLDPIVALYRSDSSAWNVELASNEESSGSADAIGVDAKSADRKSLIAVIHWEGDQLPLRISEIVRDRAVLAEIDLSAVGQSRRGAAVAIALQGLSKGGIDLVISSNARCFQEVGVVDGDCIVINFEHDGTHLSLATQQLQRLGRLLSDDVAKVLPFELGLSLKEVRFIEEVAISSTTPSEPFRRTLRKLRSLGVACLTDSPDGLNDRGDYFRLAPGWTTEAAADEVSVVFSCNDPGEPCTWISLRASRRCNRTLAVANSLLSLIATPDLEWHRWLA